VSQLANHQLSFYFGVTLLTTVFIVALAIILDNEAIAFLAVLMPSSVAIVMTGVLHGRKGVYDLLVSRSVRPIRWSWVTLSIFLFAFIAVIAIVIHSVFGGPTFELRTTEILPQILVILLIALGEEYGWRGFALPRLQQRHHALLASLILGLVWGFWHYPASLINIGVPQDMPFYTFMLWVIPATTLFTWVYNKTQSVLATILLHSGANATFNYLPILPEFTRNIQTFYIFLTLVWLFTLVIVVAGVFEPSRLK
jgi:membrane protease YdiL (CAAX protease family)